jgi:hypothetical protein
MLSVLDAELDAVVPAVSVFCVVKVLVTELVPLLLAETLRLLV